MGRVIYLTGAPATGKSAICRVLEHRYQERIRIFSYSLLLRATVVERTSLSLNAQEIRQQSAALVTREDVVRTDEKLIKEVRETRASRHVIVDSHPVTKEVYGFRATAFTIEQLQELNPDLIVCTYAAPEVIEGRMKKDAQGRMPASLHEFDMHVNLQASVAAQYGVILGRPSYFLDTSPDLELVVDRFVAISKVK